MYFTYALFYSTLRELSIDLGDSVKSGLQSVEAASQKTEINRLVPHSIFKIQAMTLAKTFKSLQGRYQNP